LRTRGGGEGGGKRERGQGQGREQEGQERLTSVSQTWIKRLVRNQCRKVPSAGIMCGYCFVFCAALSLADSGGPGYWRGGGRLRRAGCEGGLNLAGFSSARGLGWEVALLDAARERMVGGGGSRGWGLEVGDERKIGFRGRRKRGMCVVDIVEWPLRIAV